MAKCGTSHLVLLAKLNESDEIQKDDLGRTRSTQPDDGYAYNLESQKERGISEEPDSGWWAILKLTVLLWHRTGSSIFFV